MPRALALSKALQAPSASVHPIAEASSGVSWPKGRLLEISGIGDVAITTTAAHLLLEAQQQGETTAWVQPEPGALFPPDFAALGVDLEALLVVHVPTASRTSPLVVHLAQTLDLLVRSGGFGLLIADLRWPNPFSTRAPLRLDDAKQGRLAGLAREHACSIVFLTHQGRGEDSLGPLIAHRILPRRTRPPRTNDAPSFAPFLVEPQVLKHKAGPIPRLPASAHCGPPGLR